MRTQDDAIFAALAEVRRQMESLKRSQEQLAVIHPVTINCNRPDCGALNSSTYSSISTTIDACTSKSEIVCLVCSEVIATLQITSDAPVQSFEGIIVKVSADD